MNTSHDHERSAFDNTLIQQSIAVRLADVHTRRSIISIVDKNKTESNQQFESFVGECIPDSLIHDRDTHEEGKERDIIYENYVDIDDVPDYSDYSEENEIENNVEILSLHSMLTSTTCSDEDPISADDDSNELSESTRSILKSPNSRSRRHNLSTSFSTLEIREYDITLGDNPGGCQGPPVTLDWDYNKRQTKVIPVEEYEEKRPPRRCRSGMHMPDNMRMQILLRHKGFTLTQVKRATRDAKLIRMQRRKSSQYYSMYERFLNGIVNRFRRRRAEMN